MNQHQTSNMRYQQMKEGNPTLPNDDSNSRRAAGDKKLCIVWHNGRKMLFFYRYLISVEF